MPPSGRAGAMRPIGGKEDALALGEVGAGGQQQGAPLADVADDVVEIDRRQHALVGVAVEDDEVEVLDLPAEQVGGGKGDHCGRRRLDRPLEHLDGGRAFVVCRRDGDHVRRVRVVAALHGARDDARLRIDREAHGKIAGGVADEVAGVGIEEGFADIHGHHVPVGVGLRGRLAGDDRRLVRGADREGLRGDAADRVGGCHDDGIGAVERRARAARGHRRVLRGVVVDRSGDRARSSASIDEAGRKAAWRTVAERVAVARARTPVDVAMEMPGLSVGRSSGSGSACCRLAVGTAVLHRPSRRSPVVCAPLVVGRGDRRRSTGAGIALLGEIVPVIKPAERDR